MLIERGLMTQKEAILSQYGVDRIRDLTTQQLDSLIDGLKLIAIPAQAARPDVAPEIRKARSLVLSLLDDLGVKAKSGNWQPVNDYLMQPRIAGKRLDKMTEQELKACATRLRMVAKKQAKSIDEDNRKARFN